MPPPTQNSLNFCAFCVGGGGFTLFSQPRSNISESATAYVRMYICTFAIFPHTAFVMNVMAEILAAGLVRVSWDRLDIPEITSYVVYYSRQSAIEESLSVNVSSSEKSVIIDDLMTGVEYQFQVVAEAQLINGEILVGERSERTTVLTTSAQLSNKS